MQFESTGNLSRAESTYDDILSEDPSNDIILKRKVGVAQSHFCNDLRSCLQVAICKTRGDLVAAAQTLNTYLDTFMMDRDAWEELAEIYLKVSRSHPDLTQSHSCVCIACRCKCTSRQRIAMKSYYCWRRHI